MVIGCSVAAAEVAAGAVEARADDGAPGGDVEGAAVGVEGFAGDVELFVFVEQAAVIVAAGGGGGAGGGGCGPEGSAFFGWWGGREVDA